MFTPALMVGHPVVAMAVLLGEQATRIQELTAANATLTAKLAGYARITASFPAPGSHARYVIASPLYIDYAAPPTV